MSDTLDFPAVATHFAEAYGLTPGAGAALAEFLGTCKLRTLAKGDELFKEHDLGTELYLVLQGKIAATRKDPRGQPIRVASLEAPSIVGHMSLIDGSPRSATCTARRNDTVVAAVDHKTYRSLVDSVGPRGSVVRHLLLAAMSEQLSSANDRIRTLIDPRTIGDMDDETTEHGIALAANALDGWTKDEKD